MEMLVIAVLFGLSLTLILTAKIAKMMDLNSKILLRFGIYFCFAAWIPWLLAIIPKMREDPKFLFAMACTLLSGTVFDLIATFYSKEEVIPPRVPVKKPGQNRIARMAKEVSSCLLMGFAMYFMARGSLPFLEQMSYWDMLAFKQMSHWDLLACGFFIIAAIIRGFLSLIQEVEICKNGLLDQIGFRPKLRPWETFESFSWMGETMDGVELRLQASLADQETTPLMVRYEDREVVGQILKANLPNQLWDANGLNQRVLPPHIPVKRMRLRRFVEHIASVLCWPAIILLLVYLWNQSVSLETFSGVGFLSIMITMAVDSWLSKKIEICRNGLVVGDELKTWKEYECFFWKGETDDGVELWLRSKTTSVTCLVVAPKDRETVQQLLEANLRDQSTDSEMYSGWSLW